MKILYDHQAFSATPFGGISKYHIELIRQFQSFGDISAELSCKYSNNENLLDFKRYDAKPLFRQHNFRGKIRLISTINTFHSIRKIRNSSFDIFHPTYYDDYFLPYLSRKPFVITCHDFIHEKFHKQFDYLRMDPIFNKGKKRIVLEKSDAIIAVSQNTKNDIIEHYHIAPEKIKVIYLAHEQNNTNLTDAPALPQHYILYIGNRIGYKNFPFFADAMSEVLKKFPDFYIVCAGGGAFTREEEVLLDTLQIRNRVVNHPINRSNLPALYGNATVFVFPSLYEGFGIPVLEAFCNGCPAVLSNRGSLPEVGGNAALYFDPEQKESLITVATNVLEDAKTREVFIQRGLDRFKDFSWEKTAAQTHDVYKEITGKQL